MKRLDDIEAREAKASEEIGRLAAGNPGIKWRWSIPANPELDSDLILADSLADIPALTAAVRGVLDLHYCVPGLDYCGECGERWPCATVTTITTTLEGTP